MRNNKKTTKLKQQQQKNYEEFKKIYQYCLHNIRSVVYLKRCLQVDFMFHGSSSKLIILQMKLFSDSQYVDHLS